MRPVKGVLPDDQWQVSQSSPVAGDILIFIYYGFHLHFSEFLLIINLARMNFQVHFRIKNEQRPRRYFNAEFTEAHCIHLLGLPYTEPKSTWLK